MKDRKGREVTGRDWIAGIIFLLIVGSPVFGIVGGFKVGALALAAGMFLFFVAAIAWGEEDDK